MKAKTKKPSLTLLGLMLVMLFTFAACEFDLVAYKEAAKAGLDTYAASKGEENYSGNNWTLVAGFVAEGKSAIDVVADKDDVDAAVDDAKKVNQYIAFTAIMCYHYRIQS